MPDLSISSPLVRVDQLLVEQGHARSRTRAQRLIKHGRVKLVEEGTDRKIDKPSEKLPNNSRFVIEEDPEERYVSRAGLKLEGLLLSQQLRLDHQTLLDIGQSTGGFSDCALAFGAARIVGVEVGHAQLDERLMQDDRVVCLEGINARALPDERLMQWAPNGFDGALMDVSFISQTLILPELARLLPSGATLFSLVKPQFELSRDEIDQRGLVRDQAAHNKVEKKISQALEDNGFDRITWQPSVITGSDGNQEWMLMAVKR
ncbi:TlyA family RNA methyltransferase [Carnimonas bestiolae]|uniref:TlyA family RNA methyltransferase n=1 Tax=Carnimonas bestiolae TaxID=3402172 RepID=UPI003EDC6010